MIASAHMQPAIRRLAEELTRRGLRVTSIVRPGPGSHGLGIALDVTTIDLRVGEYDRRTAEAVLELARRINPGTAWAVASERDHVHVEMIDPALHSWAGTKQTNGQIDLHCTTTRKKGIHMNRYSRRRGFEAGQLPAGDADAMIRAVESGAMLDETGALLDETGEFVSPQALSTGLGTPNLSPGSIAQNGGRIKDVSSSYSSLLSRRNTAIRNASPVTLAQVAAIRALSGPADTLYVFAKNARMDSSSLGAGAMLRSSEARACATVLSQGSPVPVRVVTVPVVGPNFQFDAPDPAFQPNIDFGYVGIILEIKSTIFNADPGASFSITVTPLGGPAYLTQTFTFRRLGAGEQMEITMLLGALVSGLPQFAPQQFRIGAIPTPMFRYVIAGLTVANYQINARYMVRGEERVEEFLNLIS